MLCCATLGLLASAVSDCNLSVTASAASSHSSGQSSLLHVVKFASVAFASVRLAEGSERQASATSDKRTVKIIVGQDRRAQH